MPEAVDTPGETFTQGQECPLLLKVESNLGLLGLTDNLDPRLRCQASTSLA